MSFSIAIAASGYRANADNSCNAAAFIFDPITITATQLEIEWAEERMVGMNVR